MAIGQSSACDHAHHACCSMSSHKRNHVDAYRFTNIALTDIVHHNTTCEQSSRHDRQARQTREAQAASPAWTKEAVLLHAAGHQAVSLLPPLKSALSAADFMTPKHICIANWLIKWPNAAGAKAQPLDFRVHRVCHPHCMQC